MIDRLSHGEADCILVGSNFTDWDMVAFTLAACFHILGISQACSSQVLMIPGILFSRKSTAENECKHLIKGLCPNICPGGVICLQYADDTVLFLENNLAKAKNLKHVLSCFENVSGMKINYTKSELVPIGMTSEEHIPFSNIFGCPVGDFPIKYLGIPLHYDKLRREDVQPLIDKILNRIAGWRGKLLSYKGRLVLIQACLASIPIYLLSFFKFPKWALDLINTQMAHCLWNDF